MTRIFGKKQVILATLIVALGVAVYLNYYFSSQQPPVTDANGKPTSSTSSTHNMGDAQYVGNSNVDMQTALNAGVDAVGVTWGFRPVEELQAYRPRYIARRAADILDFLD